MPQRKKIALAMSGAGARAVMYFGILDVFREHGIEINMVSAVSSATFVGCAYASGKLEQLKKYALDMDTKELFDLFEPSMKGGLFRLDRIDEIMPQFLSAENIEDLNIPVSIVASDIVNGENVIFTMGNIMRAIKASCSMPGLFEPVVWGQRILIDGGLFSIVPVEAARAWQPDIVIGVDLATTRNLFTDPILQLKRGYNFLTSPLRRISRAYGKIIDSFRAADEEELMIDRVKTPNIISVLDKAMDYAMGERKKAEYFNSDLMIHPDVKGFGDTGLGKTEAMYMEGRRAAELAIPRIKKLLSR